MDKSEMVEEAATRMRMLQLFETPEDSIIRRFAETGELFESIPALGGRVGELYSLTDAETRMVREFEKQSGCLVYHIIRNEVSMHPCGVDVQYSLLYVSGKKDEWEQDREDISDIESRVLYPDAYVYCAGDVPEDAEDISGGYGEYMKIGVVFGCGGLCRVS